MPLIMTSEINEDTRGKSKGTFRYGHEGVISLIIGNLLVLGYDPLLSPQFLQSEIPIVSSSSTRNDMQVRMLTIYVACQGD